MTSIDDVADKLKNTSVKNDYSTLVSFENQHLVLNTQEDAAPIVKAITDCPHMSALCLEGNTIGWEAAKAISKALQSKKEIQRAQWRDIFTSRSVQEIPKALNYLSSGLILAKAHLTELDLSDNAFGPIGVKNILMLLTSEVCYSLSTLRLNNNGLGPTGAKLLAQALTECHAKSIENKTPLQLKVFICGRNRLENPGAIEMAKALKAIGTLEKLELPQNGIYHEGISALSEALAFNPNLQEINLNDNTFSVKGAEAFARVIRKLDNLEVVNIGDCLTRTKGAEAIASALKVGHQALRILNLSYNEIRGSGGEAIAKVVLDKPNFSTLVLDGNYFGEEGCKSITDIMKKANMLDKLFSLSGDEGSDLEEDNDEEEDDHSEGEEDNSEDYEDVDTEDAEAQETEEVTSVLKDTKIEDEDSTGGFLVNPSASSLKRVASGGADQLLQELGEEPSIEDLISAFAKVGNVIKINKPDLVKLALEASDALLSRAFKLAESKGQISLLTNCLLVNLGLLKSEDKKFQPPSDIKPHCLLLQNAVKQDYFSSSTKDILQYFLSRPFSALEACGDVKNDLLRALFKY